MAPGIAVEPHLGRAAALDYVDDLLVEMLFRIERAGARHLDHVAAPFSFGAVELNVGAAPAEPAPRGERQVLHAPHPDVAKDRNPFGFHEQVVRRLRPAEFAEAGAASARGFMPVRLAGNVVHRISVRRTSRMWRVRAQCF